MDNQHLTLGRVMSQLTFQLFYLRTRRHVKAPRCQILSWQASYTRFLHSFCKLPFSCEELQEEKILAIGQASFGGALTNPL